MNTSLIRSILSGVTGFIPKEFRFIGDLVGAIFEGAVAAEEVLSGPGNGPRKAMLVKRAIQPILDDGLDSTPGLRALTEADRDKLINGILGIVVFSIQAAEFGPDLGGGEKAIKRQTAFASAVEDLTTVITAMVRTFSAGDAEPAPAPAAPPRKLPSVDLRTLKARGGIRDFITRAVTPE